MGRYRARICYRVDFGGRPEDMWMLVRCSWFAAGLFGGHATKKVGALETKSRISADWLFLLRRNFAPNPLRT